MASHISLEFKPSINEILPGLYLGNEETACHIPTLEKYNISSMVSMTKIRHPLMWGNSNPRFREIVPEERHLFISCTDSQDENLLVHLSDICNFIDNQLGRGLRPKPNDIHNIDGDAQNLQSVGASVQRNVLVHCQKGISRSGTAVMAYMMRKQVMDRDTALTIVRLLRDHVRPNPNFMDQLAQWELAEYDIWADVEKTKPKVHYRAVLERLERQKQEKAAAKKQWSL